MPSRVAGYQLMRPLGSSVYLGRKRPTAPMVAIKVLSPVTSRAAAVLTARLDRLSQGEEPSRQDHLLPLLDYGRKGTLFFVVTEYVEGGCLADLLEGGKLPVSQGLSLIQGVAAALDWAHARRIFQNDLSPSKVLVDAEDGALLADFGLGRTSFAPLRRSSADIGAKLEQEERARRVDIQALAGLSHQLLVGRLRAVGLRSPGPARRPRDLTTRGATGPIARPSPRVEAVLARAASHRVRDFADATALATALSDAADSDRRKGRGRRSKTPALISLSPPADETPAPAPTPTTSSRELPAPAPAEETVASVPAEPAADTPRPTTIPTPKVNSQAASGEDLIARPGRLVRLRVRVRYLAVAVVAVAALVASAWMLTSRHVERAGRDVVTVSTAPPTATVPPPVTPPSTAVTSAPATTVAPTTSAPSTEPPPPPRPPEPVVAEPPAPPETTRPPTTTRAAPVVTAPPPPPPTAPPVTATSPPPPPTNPNFP